MHDETLTINEFCAAEKVSRSQLYRFWREGKGPRFHLIGADKRISAEARQEWRRQREEEALRAQRDSNALSSQEGAA